MHFYSSSYREVMNLPIKTFWMLNSNVERISAQKDMRSLTVAVCGQDGEASQSYKESLIAEVGTIVKLEFDPISTAVRDEDASTVLKELANQT
jgi:hypothetical protein